MKQPKQICVNAKGQITIPITLRKKYDIKNRTKFILTDIGDKIVLTPITEVYFKNMQGSLNGKGGLQTLLDERGKTNETGILF